MVFDITKLIAENHGNTLCDPLVLAAGSDISHWFVSETREPKMVIDDKSGKDVFFCPTGRYLHIPPTDPNSKVADECAPFETPWWRDNENFMIGRLTRNVRKITIMNTLTKDEETIEVAQEESINEIMERYLVYNQHADSYTWKRLGKVLDMDLTLGENGIVDET